MNRISQAVPVVREIPADPYDALPVLAEPHVPAAVPQGYRVAMIEPGVGCFRIIYKDENGSPLLDWLCDYRVPAEDREWLRRIQQGQGDALPAVGTRPAPFPRPRLLR